MTSQQGEYEKWMKMFCVIAGPAKPATMRDMLKSKWLLCAVAFSMLPVMALADEPTPREVLEKLEKIDGNAQLKMMLPRWRGMVERRAWGELQNFMQVDMPEAREFFDAVRREQQKQLRNDLDRINELLAEAATSVERADAPEQLDSILKKLSDVKGEEYSSYGHPSPELQKARSQLSTTRQIVTYWQNYLNEVQTGNVSRQSNSLQNIASSLSEYQLVPRSRVLRMMEGSDSESLSSQARTKSRAAIEVICEKFRRDADVDAALKAFEQLNGNQYDNQSVQQELQKYKRLSHELPTMDAEEVVRRFRGNTESQFGLVFAKLAIKQIAKDTGAALPKEDMSIDRYVRSCAEVAIKAEDWKGAQRFLKLCDAQSGRPVDDAQALEGYLKGMEFEKSGMWGLAVAAYRTSINSPVKAFPREKVSARLEAMQKQDAQRFEAASKEITEIDAAERQRQSEFMRNNAQQPPAPRAQGAAGHPQVSQAELSKMVAREVREALKEAKAERKDAEEKAEASPAPLPAPPTPQLHTTPKAGE